MKLNFLYIGSLCLILSFCLACKQVTTILDSTGSSDQVIAEVGTKKLLLDDLAGLTSVTTSPEDSISMLKGFTNNWIKDQLLISEAEKEITQDIDIEKLVKDYRSSLLLYNYIDKLVQKELDTLVTEDEKKSYYESNKQQYVLSESILKYIYIKFENKKAVTSNFEKLWKQGEYEQVVSLAQGNANYIQDQSKSWQTVGDLLAVVPSNILRPSDVNKNLKTVKEDKQAKYYVKVIDFTSKDAVPPLDYLDDKIVSIIINERKSELVKRKKQLLFDQYFNTSKAKSYVQ